jgi:hypothetical protein
MKASEIPDDVSRRTETAAAERGIPVGDLLRDLK